MIVHTISLALTTTASTHALYKTSVDKEQLVHLIIMLESVLVNLEQLVIHILAAYRFNIAPETINVLQDRNVTVEFVLHFVHQLENVSEISYVSKESANQLVDPTILAQISNSVKTTFVQKNSAAYQMTIALLTKNASRML